MKLSRYESEDKSDVILMFQCPGCKEGHHVRIKGKEPVWEWNGSMDKPTFSPSILVWGSRPDKRCHSFVRDGKIEFLGDCFHDLKGQTVDLPEEET